MLIDDSKQIGKDYDVVPHVTLHDCKQRCNAAHACLAVDHSAYATEPNEFVNGVCYMYYT